MPALHIGLMSGTSLDGVDAVLVELPEPTAVAGRRLRVLAHRHLPFDADHAAQMLALNTPGPDELHRAALAANTLARVYAKATEAVLAAAGCAAGEVAAIGAHGQTVRHRPGEFDGTGYTVQLNNPALLAELTGIDVVADLRSRDVAAGGQGAPLVAAFHREVFAEPGSTVAVLNLGGMSNLTVIGPDGATTGFDCGPGNALMDGWTARHRGTPIDRDGTWAASGQVHAGLLAAWLADPYFGLAPPKSTGRDLFHLGWVDTTLARFGPMPPQDVQATLAELTAAICAEATLAHSPAAVRLIVCGGGAHNRHVMTRLAARLPIPVEASGSYGLPPDQVEACAFAWLARAHLQRRAGNLPGVTGASGPRVLGALYPAATRA